MVGPNGAISMLLISTHRAEITETELRSASLMHLSSDSGGFVSQPPEEGQADVLLHPLPVLQHAQNVLLRCQGKTFSLCLSCFSVPGHARGQCISYWTCGPHFGEL